MAFNLNTSGVKVVPHEKLLIVNGAKEKWVLNLLFVGRWADCLDHVWTTACTRFWNTTQPSLPWLQTQWLTRTKNTLLASILLHSSTYRHCPLRLSPGTLVWWLSMRRSKNQEWSSETGKRKAVKIAIQTVTTLFKSVFLTHGIIF